MLPEKGTISAEDINRELGRPLNSALSLNSYDVRILAKADSNPVSMGDMYGKYPVQRKLWDELILEGDAKRLVVDTRHGIRMGDGGARAVNDSLSGDVWSITLSLFPVANLRVFPIICLDIDDYVFALELHPVPNEPINHFTPVLRYTSLDNTHKTLSSSVNISANRWVNIALTYDKGDMAIYINATSSVLVTDPIDLVSTSWLVGKDVTDTNKFSGYMTDLSLWAVPLSAQQLLSLVYRR